MKIYIDESGHTGVDLLNDDQSIFAVASNVLSDEEASEIYNVVFGVLHKHYPKANEPGFELKHKLLMQSGPGRKRSIDFIKRLQELGKKTFTYSTHKEYALLCILVDQWIETAHYENDIDFYAYDRARYYARIVFHSFLHSNSRRLLRDFLNTCVNFIRNPSVALLRSLSELMEIGFHHKNEIIKDFFHLIDWSLQTIGIGRTASNALDLTYTSLVSIAVFWLNTHSDRFHIIHDESNEVSQHSESWERLTHQENLGALFEMGGQKIEFPLRIDGLVEMAE